MSKSYFIRKATSADAKTILGFITELAIYEKAEHEVLATEETIRDTIFGENSIPKALICEDSEGKAVGFAVYFYNYSTWLAKKGIHLEDLYVTKSERGKGAGKKLITYLAAQAVAEGCGRFEWSVLDWNKPAIDFYESIGAKPQSEWTVYRLTGEPLVKLAESIKNI